MANSSQLFHLLVIRSWWVILLLMIGFFLYDQTSHHQNKTIAQLEEKLALLTKKKEKAAAIQEDLKLQIISQEDPEYLEMVLIKKLGLIREGQTKIFFPSEKKD